MGFISPCGGSVDVFELLQNKTLIRMLKHIPVIVLTTSDVGDDIRNAYDLGGSSFVVKPSSLDELVGTVGAIWKYWCEIVKLPENASNKALIENAPSGRDVLSNE